VDSVETHLSANHQALRGGQYVGTKASMDR